MSTVDPSALASADAEKDSPLPYAEGQGDYDPLELIELQKRLSDIAFDMDKPFSAVVHDLGVSMKDFFGTRFVEFLMVEGDNLVYKYINDMPEALDRFAERVGADSGVIGMRIPLFEGSFFTELIEKGVPREILTREELLHSFRDFVAPKNRLNIALRKHLAPMLMPLLGYDYIFQIPLVSDRRVIGYFSFLQRGRIRPRMRADLVLMSYQIAGFLALRSQKEQRQRLFDSLPSPTIRFAAKGLESKSTLADFVVAAVNPAFKALFPVDAEKLLGASASELGARVAQPEAVAFMREVLYTAVPRRVELDRQAHFLSAIISRIDDEELIVTIEDISQRKKIEREITEAASHDALTGLYNRRVFMDLLAKEFSAMAREGGSGGLFFLDLNRFKQINDSFGHDAGDLLLRHVAAVLSASLRASDYVARLGGDEFVLFCRKVDSNSALLVAAKIAQAFASSPLELGGQTVHAEASIGIAVYPDAASCPEALLSAADKAMYRSKKERLPYCLFDAATMSPQA
jgi:diguanylate cyclase (GGDEF)-like protein